MYQGDNPAPYNVSGDHPPPCNVSSDHPAPYNVSRWQPCSLQCIKWPPCSYYWGVSLSQIHVSRSLRYHKPPLPLQLVDILPPPTPIWGGREDTLLQTISIGPNPSILITFLSLINTLCQPALGWNVGFFYRVERGGGIPSKNLISNLVEFSGKLCIYTLFRKRRTFFLQHTYICTYYYDYLFVFFRIYFFLVL